MSAQKISALFLPLVLSLAIPSGAATTFSFDSQGFEAVGNNESGTYTDADGTWSIRGFGNPSITGTFVGIRLGFTNDDRTLEDPDWILQFRNEETSELAVGAYSNMGRFTDLTTTGMSIFNDMTCEGDDDPTNEFTVSEVEYDVYARPIRFAASFVLRCSPGQNPLLGTIDYTFDGNLEAPGFADGNVLVSLDSVLYEYNPAGALVQALPVGRGPSPATFFGLDDRGSEPARDLAMSEGVLYLYNEQSNLGQFTFADRLSRLSTMFASGTWMHNSFDAEWNQSNQLESALAVVSQYVFTVDGPVGGDARGLVRFDTSNGYAAQRFEDGEFYKDVAGGLDGQLYALRVDRTTVEVFNPMTLANVGTINLDASANAIAVDATSTIFGVGGPTSDGVTIYDFGTTGTTQNSLDMDASLPFGITMIDVDISPVGKIAVGLSEYGASSPNGEFIVSDDTLAAGALIEIDPSPNEQLTFVAFVAPEVPIYADGFEAGDTNSWSSTSP